MHTLQASSDLLEQALRLAQAGVSVVPCDDKKTPLISWKPLQQRIATEREIRYWFREKPVLGIAVVGGKVSSNLLIIDFDMKNAAAKDLYETWVALAPATLQRKLVWQQTGSGGRQALFRCPHVGGNEKLAWVSDPNEKSGRSIAIETRGEGGYAIVAPSLHPSGNYYRLISPDITALSLLSQDEAEALLDMARCLDSAPMERADLLKAVRTTKCSATTQRSATPQRYATSHDVDVIACFRKANNLTDMLESYGYMRRGNRYIRPDAPPGSVPGVTILHEEISYHHSSNDPLNDAFGKSWHDVFDVYAWYEHHGDRSAAYKAAACELGLWNTSRASRASRDDALRPYLPSAATTPRPATTPYVPRYRVNTTTGEIS